MIKSWMVIGGITLLISLGGILFRPKDIQWASRLERPKWLFFEPAIPLIWTVIFICGAASAVLVWEAEPGSLKTWLLMGCYLLLEVITVAYIPATIRSRKLLVGTILGGTGILIGVLLTIFAWSISSKAALLLLPYVVWTPIGTYTTREMIDLNPDAV